MNRLQRTVKIINGIFFLVCAALLLLQPKQGFYLVMLILSATLIIIGVKSIVFFFTMARHMVGGRSVFYRGLIVFDVGIFALTLSDAALAYVILFLVAVHLFAGGVDILRAMEAKRWGSPQWKFKMFSGLINVILALLAFLFGSVFRSSEIVVILYSASIIYSGITSIVSALRRTAITYVE